MRPLYLIRHASPAIQPEVPARDWQLSDQGIEEARAIAEVAGGWAIEALYASSEPKARTTALIVGDAVGLSVNVADAFDELRMPDWISNSDEFNQVVQAILEGQEAGGGYESAEQAAARFAAGVRIVEDGPFPAAIVSHGRILTSWLAARGSIEDAFAFWRSIPMPGWALLDLDAGGLSVPFTAAGNQHS
jgi:broad specificity phosphatase PhoE